MDYEQKFAALAAISHGASLQIRKPGDWYVFLPDVEQKQDHVLSSIHGSGRTPEDAVNTAWTNATNPKYYLALNAYRENRRAVRWNGFMWEDVVETKNSAV